VTAGLAGPLAAEAGGAAEVGPLLAAFCEQPVASATRKSEHAIDPNFFMGYP